MLVLHKIVIPYRRITTWMEMCKGGVISKDVIFAHKKEITWMRGARETSHKPFIDGRMDILSFLLFLVDGVIEVISHFVLRKTNDAKVAIRNHEGACCVSGKHSM